MQIEEEGKHDLFAGFISDRSTLDNAAYALESKPPESRKLSQFDSENHLQYYNKSLKHAQSGYDLLILVPINGVIGLVDDGFRHTTDLDFRQKIENNVKQFLTNFDLWGKTHVLTSTDLDERVREAVRAYHAAHNRLSRVVRHGRVD